MNELSKINGKISGIIYKVFLINEQYHIFAAKEGNHECKTIHYKYDIASQRMTKMVGIDYNDICQLPGIPKLLKILYVKKLNKFIAIDSDMRDIYIEYDWASFTKSIEIKKTNYVKKIYCCDLNNNYKWSMKKVILRNINYFIGRFECNGAIVCYETILVLFCNIGTFTIDLLTMKAYNANKQPFGPELCLKVGIPKETKDVKIPEECLGDIPKDELEREEEEKIRRGYPGKIDCVLNEDGNKMYGFHFGMPQEQGLRTDFFHF